jgi:hypothetical protein
MRKRMTRTVYRGVVRGGMILLDEETPLSEGTAVLVTPMASVPGSPAAIVAAMENSDKVPPEWVDELEQLIAEGRRPPTPPVSFLDTPESR